MSTITPVGVDTSEADLALERLQLHAKTAGNIVMRNVRKGYQSIALLSDLAGISIPMYYSMFAEAAFMGYRAMMQLGAWETMSGAGLLKAVGTFAIAAMMFNMGIQMMNKKQEAAGQLNSLIQLSNLWIGGGY